MCGIAGLIALAPGLAPPAPETLTRMAAAMHHRGPDEFGIYCDDRAGLSHARLSIIDLASGQQPLASLDDDVLIVFNGEIFNYVELRDELSAEGRRFRTKSDTEVIIAAWERWGEGCLERLNGQWAFALWDKRRARLVLCRDRLGVRPLHVAEHGGYLYFASEVKAIFAADRAIPRELDPHGLDQAFTLWAPVAPRTPFAAVRELVPGTFEIHELASSPPSRRVASYWSPTFLSAAGDTLAAAEGSVQRSAEATLAALQEATRLRMVRADVPVGSYLSGGLDSSLVAALGLRAKGERFKTFSLRFADAEFDETEFQDAMVKMLETEHQSVVVSRDDIGRVFPEVVYHAERPLMRTAPAPLFLLSKLVRDVGIKVVLTGEGADEVFGGYDLFREGKVRRFWAKQPKSTCRPRLLERLYPYLARSPVDKRALATSFFGRGLDRATQVGFAHDMRWRNGAALRRLFHKDVAAELAGSDVVRELLDDLPAEVRSWAPLGQDQLLEMKTLLGGYLLSSQGDRMLMANSVEGRFPFLDKQVVELASRLPARHKLRGLDEKHVLKQAARGIVPASILARKKQPYRAPDALSFLGAGAAGYADELLSQASVSRAGVFDPGAVGKLWAKCKTSQAEAFSNADNMALVGVLSTQLLYTQLVLGSPACPDVRLTTHIDRRTQR
ncbi:MAG: asparagine synthase (glutamine-hydrolyzing) [Polyangiaceae bacterium]|nr:asparagine synthase (glutamine-hydrolyzing) [Polyangiaceae bacterium]